MNVKQQEWTQKRCDYLKGCIEKSFPLSEKQWEGVADYIAKVVEQAKGNYEVRAALFDIVEPYQKKAEELIN